MSNRLHDDTWSNMLLLRTVVYLPSIISIELSVLISFHFRYGLPSAENEPRLLFKLLIANILIMPIYLYFVAKSEAHRLGNDNTEMDDQNDPSLDNSMQTTFSPGFRLLAANCGFMILGFMIILSKIIG
jgi:hypothetical protein